MDKDTLQAIEIINEILEHSLDSRYNKEYILSRKDELDKIINDNKDKEE